MRVTVLFFIIALILMLTSWALYKNPTRYHPLLRTPVEQVYKLESLNDVKSLRKEAINMLTENNKKTMEREVVYAEMYNWLVLITLLTFVALIITFLEIAARGRMHSKQNVR